MICAGTQPSLPPSIESESSLASFMCLPMMPAGPLKVVMKPILTLSAAPAGAANSSNAATAVRYFFMSPPYSPNGRRLLRFARNDNETCHCESPRCDPRRRSKPLGGPYLAGQLHILEIPRHAVDAGARRRDP